MPLTTGAPQQDWLNYYYSGGGKSTGISSDEMNRLRGAYALSLQPPPAPRGAKAATPGNVPALSAPPTDFARYQTSVLSSNQQALPQMSEIARIVNEFNLGQKTNQLRTGLPNYDALTAKSSENIGSNLRGELPPDVRALIATSAAERAVGQGMPAGAYGSTMPNFDLLRTLGLTSLQRKDLGESQLTGAVARTPQVPIYSPSEQFITPQQAAQYDLNMAYLNKPQNRPYGGGGGGGNNYYMSPPKDGSSASAAGATQPADTTVPGLFGAVRPTQNTPSTADQSWKFWGSSPMSVSLGGGGMPPELPTYPWTAPQITQAPWQAPSVWESGLGQGLDPMALSPYANPASNPVSNSGTSGFIPFPYQDPFSLNNIPQYEPEGLEQQLWDYLDYGG